MFSVYSTEPVISVSYFRTLIFTENLKVVALESSVYSSYYSDYLELVDSRGLCISFSHALLRLSFARVDRLWPAS